MKSSDRSILIGLVILGLGAAFWFMVLAPKREEAAQLQDTVTGLQSEISTQEQLVATAEQAQQTYDRNFGKLVAFGKATPDEVDTPSLLVQIKEFADRSRVSFDGLVLSEDDAPAPTAASETTTDQNLDASTEAGTTTEGAAVPPTEAAVAPAASGTAVGSAGLEVQKYEMSFGGSFFEVADLLASFDGVVHANEGRLTVDGRLLTVDGFTIEIDDESGGLNVQLTASSYVLPSSEGLTDGATPAAPSGIVPASTAPAPLP